MPARSQKGGVSLQSMIRIPRRAPPRGGGIFLQRYLRRQSEIAYRQVSTLFDIAPAAFVASLCAADRFCSSIISAALMVPLVVVAAVSMSTALSSPAHGAPLLDPNRAYCLGAEGGGSPWCGYDSLVQCQASASGTGHECIENTWLHSGDETLSQANHQATHISRKRLH
ncbi:DUF3551 domain-containing protein [Tardiphaga robiniae]|uniref:DUF3551 domain-containing protein n=1 Tax=Tardiphaga robiniae TaxID=943830 RepID=A0A7G6TTZ0_9BRAD|nr:DUF3551 domain-containing protein [Tardiphaga robiniae]